MASEENKKVDYIEKEGLNKRQEKKLRSMLFPEKSFKDKTIDAGKKVLEIGKKAVEFTPPGQVKKLVELVKDKTKKNTGVKVNKGDGPSKVNTGPKSNPGSSNPKRPGIKFGGRAGYKGGKSVKKKGGKSVKKKGGCAIKGKSPILR